MAGFPSKVILESVTIIIVMYAFYTYTGPVRCLNHDGLGENIIIAMPTSATNEPTMSQVVGRIPSTAQSQNMATIMYTPPYAA